MKSSLSAKDWALTYLGSKVPPAALVLAMLWGPPSVLEDYGGRLQEDLAGKSIATVKQTCVFPGERPKNSNKPVKIITF